MDILKGPAPVMSLAAPNMVRLDDNTSDGVQTVRMRVTSPRQAPLLWIFVGSNTKVLAAMVNGKRIDTGEPPAPLEGGKRWGLFYWGLPKEGIELTLEIHPSAPLEIVVVDTSYGLPQIPTMSFKARPNSMMPAPFPFLSDMTLVSKSFAF